MVSFKNILSAGIALTVCGCSVSGLSGASNEVIYTAPNEYHISFQRTLDKSPEQIRKNLRTLFLGGHVMDIIKDQDNLITAVGYTENINDYVDCGVIKRIYSSKTMKNITFEYNPISTTQYLMAINGDGFLIDSQIGISRVGAVISFKNNNIDPNKTDVDVFVGFTIPQTIITKDKHANTHKQTYNLELNTIKGSHNKNNGVTCVSTGKFENGLFQWINLK